jgi:hypothetical protein
MKNKSNTKTKKVKSSAEKLALGKALRSTGLLLPETEDEIDAFNQLYGNTPIELPEKLKTINFLFEDEKQSNTHKIIPISSFLEDKNIPQLAYAARDGQDGLPENILNKMATAKKEKRKKTATKKK